MTNNQSISQKLLPGVLALLALFIYFSFKSSPGDFFNWFAQTIIVNAAWFFLLKGIMTMIIDHQVERKFIVPMCIGAFALIVLIVVYKTTPENILVSFLQATVLYSVLITIYGLLRDKINEKW